MRGGILHAEATTPSTTSSGRSSWYCGDFYWRVGRAKDTRTFDLGGDSNGSVPRIRKDAGRGTKGDY